MGRSRCYWVTINPETPKPEALLDILFGGLSFGWILYGVCQAASPEVQTPRVAATIGALIIANVILGVPSGYYESIMGPKTPF